MTDKQQFEIMATELSNSSERNGLNLYESEIDLLAIDLYNAGYRKVPENAAVSEIAKAWCEAWDKSRAKTAKEIFSEIYKLLNSIKKQDYEDGVIYYCADVEEFDDKLCILAQQCGVEVDER